MKRCLCLLLALLLALGGAAFSEADAPDQDTNLLYLYWADPNADYETCDVWVWFPGADGRGYLFEECDYGVRIKVEVPADVTQVGFIVRRDCSEPGGTSWGSAVKDYDGDRYADILGKETHVYLKSGDGAMYKSDDGGVTLYQDKKLKLAGISKLNEIQYFLEPAVRIESLEDVHVWDGDREVGIVSLSSLNNNVTTGRVTLAENLDISRSYTLEIEGYGKRAAVPTGVFDTQEFIDEFTYDGDDLGATIVGDKTVFKLWAPTASAVRVNIEEHKYDPIFDVFTENSTTVDMVRGEKGVWSAEAPCGHGAFYTYSVTTAEGTQEAVDPYARAVGVNGDRGMVVDLSSTDPEGFDTDSYFGGIDAYNEAIIWEVHVRDFSNKLSESKYPGKYLAFTETGLRNASGEKAGMDYLKDLGVTHVHLQPVYDFATVDETGKGRQFNWGYDPKNYNAPEGSYSTDPEKGEVRINEFKQMVQAIHDAGMGVIMDVVYNHTYALDSNLNRCVPYYYYRFNANGEPSNGSGCGNETASERVMMRKYIVDSVYYWAGEYHVDGFRFDLMALHDVQTMQEVE
ncbi:MAG: type I pullulanase, partial [Clostridia bacterium]|nr:type I pullulanase [Clostridia bacterium]